MHSYAVPIDAATSPHYIKPQPERAQRFFDWLFDPGDVIESRCGVPPSQKHWHKAGDVRGDLDEIITQRGVFVGVNPRMGEGLSGDANVKHARVVFVDFDPGESKGETTYNVGRPERVIEHVDRYTIHLKSYARTLARLTIRHCPQAGSTAMLDDPRDQFAEKTGGPDFSDWGES